MAFNTQIHHDGVGQEHSFLKDQVALHVLHFEKRAIEHDEDAVCNWKRDTWPGLKEKPDEKADRSSLYTSPESAMRATRMGQTTVIQFHFNWNHVSVAAALTRINRFLRLHEDSIRKEEIVGFLKALKAHLKQPLLSNPG